MPASPLTRRPLRKRSTQDTLVNSPSTPSSARPDNSMCHPGPAGEKTNEGKLDSPSPRKHSRAWSLSCLSTLKLRRNSDSTIVGDDGPDSKEDTQTTSSLRKVATIEEEECIRRSTSDEDIDAAMFNRTSRSFSTPSTTSFSPIDTHSSDASATHTISDEHKREREKKETVRSAAILAARALVNVAEASNVPYVKGIAGLVQLIMEYTDGASENKEDCKLIYGYIRDLSGSIEHCLRERVFDKTLNEDLKCLRRSFKRVLQQVKKLSDNDRSYFQRFIRQEEDRQTLQRVEKELGRAYAAFNLRSQIRVHSTITDMSDQLKQMPGEIIRGLHDCIKQETQNASNYESSEMITEGELVEEPGELCANKIVQDGSRKSYQQKYKAPVILLDSFDASLQIPVARRIFYGRERDLNKLVGMVTDNSAARIAILGTGGIGKSTLAIALMHQKDIVDKFGQYRYFVRCDTANSSEGLVSVLVNALGLTKLENAVWREAIAGIKKALSGASSSDEPSSVSYPAPFSCLLVLDNFETPWEPSAGKRDVEELLMTLADVEGLTLILTLRGVERPAGIDWTKPFLPVLQTLESTAARRMFKAISDADYPDSTDPDAPDDLDELLALCGNLPLAVELAAHQAQPELETIPELIKRWKEESPHVVSSGEDRQHNLGTSIEVSIHSPRLKEKPEACKLLGALSSLPDGLNKSELGHAFTSLNDIKGLIIVLQKTSLAYVDGRNRIRVLAPIRAYMSKHHPPAEGIMWEIRNYLWGMIKTRGSLEDGLKTDAVRRAVQELGNIESLVRNAFKYFDPVPAIQAAVDLGRFCNHACVPCPPLLEDALRQSRLIGDKRLEADCLSVKIARDIFIKYGSYETIDSDIEKATRLYEEINDKRGVASCLERLGKHYHNRRRFKECKDVLMKAVGLWEELDDHVGQACSLLHLSRCHRVLSDPVESFNCAEKALMLARGESNDLYMPIKELQALQQLGDICTTFDCNYKRAEEYFVRALAIAEKLGLEESSHYAILSTSLGEVYIALSDYERARGTLRLAIKLFTKLSVNDRAAYASNKLAVALLRSGEIRLATDAIERSASLWEKANNEWGRGVTMMIRGDLALAKRELVDARYHYEQALLKVKADSECWKALEAECLRSLGVVKKEEQQRAEALAYVHRALDIFRACKQKFDETYCIRLIAEWMLSDPLTDSDGRQVSMNYLQDALKRYDDMGLDKERRACEQLLAFAKSTPFGRPVLQLRL